jgi:predicted ferric reductase
VCLRRPFYEVFIKSHHILAIAALYAIWRHLPTKDVCNRYYILGGTVIFIGTMLIHSFSMMIRNIMFCRPLPRTHITPQKDAIKLTVSNARPSQLRAGQFFQLRIPGISFWSFFQSHPFAVAWWHENEDGRATSLSFLVEVQGGFTHKLFQHASSHASFLTWADGPYGLPMDLDGYGSVLMFASGIRIAAQIPYIKEILKQRRQWRSSVRNISVAWEIDDSSVLSSLLYNGLV